MSSIQQHPQLLNFLILDGNTVWRNEMVDFTVTIALSMSKEYELLNWQRLSEHYKVCCSLDFHSAVKEQASPACSFIIISPFYKKSYSIEISIK